MRCHWLRLRATAHPTEDVERVGEAVQFLTSLSTPDFEPLAEAIALESHHGGTVTLLQATVTRQPHIRAALAHMLPDRSAIGDPDLRMDDDGVLYLRFSKQLAAQGTVRLTRGEDDIQVRLKPEIHPSSRDAALAAIRTWVEG